jgi:site-specific recombinase XerD
LDTASRRQVTVQRSDWKGKVTATKGDRPQVVPMTSRLASALKAHKHLRGPRVLCLEDGNPLTQKIVRNLARRSAERAGLAKQGVHILRHTFCSHLAMRGAPVRAIQELAGHSYLSTTQRYMHLSPATVEGAVGLLQQPSPVSRFGDILETEDGPITKSRD